MPFGLGGKVLSNQPKNKSAFNGRLSWGRCSVEVTGKASLRRSLSFAFQVVLQKEERGWQVRSFREPSLIVIKTGVRYPHVSDQFAGGLAKIAIEATGEESEVSFSFDFRLWYFSHLIFELFEAFVLFGVFVPKYLESQSPYAIPIIALLAFGLFYIPWGSHKCTKNTEEEIIAKSEALLGKHKSSSSLVG